jgi:hypothetical protein
MAEKSLVNTTSRRRFEKQSSATPANRNLLGDVDIFSFAESGCK